LNKVKETFTDEEQRFFITNFHCYFHCKPSEFKVDLDNVWRFIGFSQKVTAKRILEKHFIINEDYKISYYVEKTKGKGGYNKETILMTLSTFKTLCIFSETERGKTIRRFFIKMEELLYETINNEIPQFIEGINSIIEKAEEFKKDDKLPRFHLFSKYRYNGDYCVETKLNIHFNFSGKRDEDYKFDKDYKEDIINLFGNIDSYTDNGIDKEHIHLFEKYICSKLRHYKLNGDFFELDEYEAFYMILTDIQLFNLYSNFIFNDKVRKGIVIDIYKKVKEIIDNATADIASTDN
jgi:phage anti-repressor protein